MTVSKVIEKLRKYGIEPDVSAPLMVYFFDEEEQHVENYCEWRSLYLSVETGYHLDAIKILNALDKYLEIVEMETSIGKVVLKRDDKSGRKKRGWKYIPQGEETDKRLEELGLVEIKIE